MSTSSLNIDQLTATFDHDGIVANVGLILAATLIAGLGLEKLIGRWVDTGAANPARKALTVVAGDDGRCYPYQSREHVAGGRDPSGVGFKSMAPSTVGPFLWS